MPEVIPTAGWSCSWLWQAGWARTLKDVGETLADCLRTLCGTRDMLVAMPSQPAVTCLGRTEPLGPHGVCRISAVFVGGPEYLLPGF